MTRLLRTRLAVTLALVLFPSAGLRAQATAATNAASAQLVSKIDAYMAAAARVNRFSGTVLVARKGVPIFTRAYGAANVELDVPNTPETVFKVGSIAKSITAVAILQLQEEGKLSVTDSICKHLTDCPSAWTPVTLHHLLTHSSGIPRHSDMKTYLATQGSPVTQQEMLARLRKLPLDFEPGTKSVYSNEGFYLAGVIIERVTGKSYASFLNERIFGPLGMKNSGYDESRRIVKGRAAGYEIVDGQLLNAIPIDMSIPFSAGSIYSTVHDLLRFEQALRTDRLLSGRSREQMYQAHLPMRGYGWTVRRQFDRPSISKDGMINGFDTDLATFPEDDVTIIVLGNNGSASAKKITSDLAAIIFGAPYDIPAPRIPIALDAEILRRYAGNYRLDSGSEITLRLDRGKLLRRGEDGTERELIPESTTSFFIPDRDIVFTFQLSEDGTPTGFVIRNAGRQVAAKRFP